MSSTRERFLITAITLVGREERTSVKVKFVHYQCWEWVARKSGLAPIAGIARTQALALQAGKDALHTVGK